MFFIICVIIIFIIIIFIYILFLYKHNNQKNKLCKTYFINLDEHIDRWNNLSYRKYNNNIVRFSAINGKKINKTELINNNIIKPINSLQLGQIGCALSHIGVLNLIKNQKEPYGLILEDDAIIPDNFSINQLKLPKKFDILFLGGCNIKGKKIGTNLIKPTALYGTYNLCLHAVLVNKNSVDKILNALLPLYRPIDSQLRDKYDDFNIFYHYPNLINQNKSLRSIRRDIDGLPQSKYWQTHHLDITIEK
jgi:GR25 family glycosyltransferase involved in LPS biosynthesis